MVFHQFVHKYVNPAFTKTFKGELFTFSSACHGASFLVMSLLCFVVHVLFVGFVAFLFPSVFLSHRVYRYSSSLAINYLCFGFTYCFRFRVRFLVGFLFVCYFLLLVLSHLCHCLPCPHCFHLRLIASTCVSFHFLCLNKNGQ